MLRLEAVEYREGEFRLIADLDVAGPGVTAVIGPSGGGKSTLLSLIGGFVLPSRGRILWEGRDLAGLVPGERPVATLFQDNNLFPHLDVVTNVALGMSPRAKPTKDAVQHASEALGKVGLAGFEARMPGSLSGGQQSRAALARVLLTDRPVVLMDEAFSALGPAMRVDMLELVVQLLADKTVLMVTHDPGDARRVAPWTIFVEGGTVHPPEETRRLLDKPSEALAAYLA